MPNGEEIRADDTASERVDQFIIDTADQAALKRLEAQTENDLEQINAEPQKRSIFTRASEKFQQMTSDIALRRQQKEQERRDIKERLKDIAFEEEVKLKEARLLGAEMAAREKFAEKKRLAMMSPEQKREIALAKLKAGAAKASGIFKGLGQSGSQLGKDLGQEFSGLSKPKGRQLKQQFGILGAPDQAKADKFANLIGFGGGQNSNPVTGPDKKKFDPSRFI